MATRTQEQQQQDVDQQLDDDNALPPYYVVFSTSCTDQQNWESYILFYHCYRIRQRGTITRIVSGCSDEQRKQLQYFHDRYVTPHFGKHYNIHFTPDYSRVSLENNKFSYKYMNKPYGLLDWLHNGPLQLKQYISKATMDSNMMTTTGNIPSQILDGIVFLLDPDMILLRPLTHDFRNQEVIFVPQNQKNEVQTKIVKHGYPISQQDGYLNNEWMKLNWERIFENYTQSLSLYHNTTISTLFRPSYHEGPIYWNSGPPYIATVKDMYHIANWWVKLAPAVHQIHPKLFAEMYGYILSTVVLQLPHTFIKSLVVSTTETTDREGWDYVDQLPDGNEMCRIAYEATTMTIANNISSTSSAKLFSKTKLPIGLHYCGRYMIGQKFFSKYRLKKNIMNCQANLLKPVTVLDGIYPNEDGIYHAISPPKADDKNFQMNWKPIPSGKPFGKRIAKRQAFMLCSLTNALNIALRFLKINTTHCTDNQNTSSRILINLNETYTVYDDPFNY